MGRKESLNFRNALILCVSPLFGKNFQSFFWPGWTGGRKRPTDFAFSYTATDGYVIITHKEALFSCVHLHSWSGSFLLDEMDAVECCLSSHPFFSLMLLRPKELWLCELGPRLRNGLPWVIRAPRFSSSPCTWTNVQSDKSGFVIRGGSKRSHSGRVSSTQNLSANSSAS